MKNYITQSKTNNKYITETLKVLDFLKDQTNFPNQQNIVLDFSIEVLEGMSRPYSSTTINAQR